MAFNIKDFLNEESKKEVIDDFPIKKISAKKLHPSGKNFYNIDPVEVEALKSSIELVGVQENLVVREITEGELAGEYEIIAGHKRHKAVMELIEEGKVTEFLPCKIDYSGSSAIRELILIFTNSTQRERSDYEKMHEIQRVRELLEEYAKNNDLTGRKRDIIAGILNTSKSTIGKLDNIRRHIIPEFMEEYKAGRISTHAANQIAGANEQGQQELFKRYKETGTIYAKDVVEYKEPEKTQIEQQEEQPKAEMQEKPQGQREEKQADPAEENKTPEENKEPEKEQQDAPAAEVTIKRQQDTTDRKTLIIAGRINPNKEYNGMSVKYFADAITNSDLFDNDFWAGWVDPAVDKAKLIENYQGLLTAFTADTGEPCQVEITNEVKVIRTEAQAAGRICIREFAELVDALILTKVVQVEIPEIDVAYWIKETAREIAGLAMYATPEELSVLQEIALRMKERAGQ